MTPQEDGPVHYVGELDTLRIELESSTDTLPDVISTHTFATPLNLRETTPLKKSKKKAKALTRFSSFRTSKNQNQPLKITPNPLDTRTDSTKQISEIQYPKNTPFKKPKHSAPVKSKEIQNKPNYAQAVIQTQSKLTLHWETIEEEIMERSDQDSSDTSRWESHTNVATLRSDGARKLMSYERSPLVRSYVTFDTQGKIAETQKVNNLYDNPLKTSGALTCESLDSSTPMSNEKEEKEEKEKKRSKRHSIRKFLSTGNTNQEKFSVIARQSSDSQAAEKFEKARQLRQDKRPRRVTSGGFGHHHLTLRKKKAPKPKKQISFSLETDLSERGKILLNDIRIDTSLYLTRREFVDSVQENSTLFDNLPELQKGSLDDLFYSLFEEPDNPTIIQYHDATSSEIKSCTITKLLQNLLHHSKTQDFHLISIFLLTYRRFLSPHELMELLIYRAFGHPTEQTKWDNWVKKSEDMRDKIVQFLCNWVDQCFFYDFQDQHAMMYMLAQFAYFLGSPPILNIFLSRTMAARTHVNWVQGKVPKPKIKSSHIILKDMNPTEIASQLTLVEFDIFSSIAPSEYIHQNWCKPDKEKLAPNIVKMISQFNSISNWVASEILQMKTAKDRAILINRFIIIAEESRALRNFNAVMAILSGLQSTPIFRLKESWSLLPNSSWDIWDNLNGVMSNENNYCAYRTVLKTSKPPTVPYIGIYLTDMVAIEEAHPDYTGENLVNLTKLEYISSILLVLEGCKKGTYAISPVPALQACLLATPSLSEEEQRLLSLSVERAPSLV